MTTTPAGPSTRRRRRWSVVTVAATLWDIALLALLALHALIGTWADKRRWRRLFACYAWISSDKEVGRRVQRGGDGRCGRCRAPSASIDSCTGCSNDYTVILPKLPNGSNEPSGGGGGGRNNCAPQRACVSEYAPSHSTCGP
jgi:hypothetical protein